MNSTHWVGLDIGGANIKIADDRGRSESIVFPLWKQPEKLAGTLQDALDRFAQDRSAVAVTMTGELADCFRTKREGVSAIVDATINAAGNRTVVFYSTDGNLLDAESTKQNYMQVAAANWHALASHVACDVNLQNAILLDIGSTTTDIIPIRDSRPCSNGLTDTQRLVAHELVYTGVARTPVCSLIQSAQLNDDSGSSAPCPLAREWFATTLDCYLTLENIDESEDTAQTADGRPSTKAASLDRLARMICADRDSFSRRDALAISTQTRDAQVALLVDAVTRVASASTRTPDTVVVSGQGEFLADTVVRSALPEARCLSLSEIAERGLSECGPAYAVAMLAARNLSRSLNA